MTVTLEVLLAGVLCAAVALGVKALHGFAQRMNEPPEVGGEGGREDS